MKSKNNKENKLFVQLICYGIVGGIAFVADYGSLWCLTEYGHIHYLTSAAIAFLFGLLVNYLLSIRWVFTERRFSNKWKEWVLFALIGIIGLGLNECLIYLISDILSMHYLLGKLVSTIVVFFWNFFARRFLIF